MPSYIRYGRGIQIPSTVQVKQELRGFIAEENVRELCLMRQRSAKKRVLALKK